MSARAPIAAHVLGMPRLGARRQLKWALEKFWAGRIGEDELSAAMADLRQTNWQMQIDAGMDMLTAGDFAYYDMTLELSELLGVVPDRHDPVATRLQRCFAMARGGEGGQASEMKKWFNTNYHYLVPEFQANQQFASAAAGAAPPDVVEQCAEALKLGLPVKATLIGPVTYLYLGKLMDEGGFAAAKLGMLDELAEAYVGIIARLQAQGAQWLQLEEPVLSLDMPQAWLNAFEPCYETMLGGSRPKVMVANYFGSAGRDHLQAIANLPVDGCHVDAHYGRDDLENAAKCFAGRTLSVGAIDGRNVWGANLPRLKEKLAPLAERSGELWISSSCSLLHVPVDASGEDQLHAAGLKVAFARQKLDEIAALARTLSNTATAADEKLLAAAPDFPIEDPGWADADNPAAELQPSKRQGDKGMPGVTLPTTTIGSLPQTSQIRAARAAWRKGELDDEQYQQRIREEIARSVKEQEELGLDLLVHGEAERNDMVEFFAYQLDGVSASANGWVQSYGSRATRPPIIHGDIARPQPMTVAWSKFAAEQTTKPMKGMLTGPITIICWSFPRADVPRMRTAFQIAEGLRAEVADLAAAGLPVIQIDEPALREGLPLDPELHQSYLAQAVAAFNRIVEGCQVQVHTHMCYGEFSNIAAAISAMDVDVISLETSRTDMAVLGALNGSGFKAGVGPGIYDVHSPRVPSVDELVGLLEKALQHVPVSRLWINPDCGLKTRGWEETRAALANLLEAARQVRASRS